MTTILWDETTIREATNGHVVCPFRATGVSIDHRDVHPGDFFVALKGDKNDGHSFVDQALAAGAVAALVTDVPLTIPKESPVVLVEDTLQALIAMGIYGRNRSKAKIIGVTGSAGKTGTKEALAHVLSCQGQTHASIKSFNNHYGVPLTMARLDPHAAFGVIEMGMNHKNEIRSLTKIVRPHVAIITTIAPAHLGNFDSIDGIAQAKAEIFEGVVPGGAAVLNCDNPFFDKLSLWARHNNITTIVGFGASKNADARLCDMREDVTTGRTDVSATILGHDVSYTLPFLGYHHVMNSLAVLAAVSLVGGDLNQAALAYATCGVLDGRGKHHIFSIDGGTMRVVDEAYNANPASMEAAIHVLGKYPGRRIVIMGDMLELGPQALDLHQSMIPHFEKNAVSMVHGCGAITKDMSLSLPAAMRGFFSRDVNELWFEIKRSFRPGDVVLIKGSNSMGLQKLVNFMASEYSSVETD